MTHHDDNFDQALQARLGTLKNLPMDMTAFDKALGAALPAPAAAPAAPSKWRPLFRPFAAVAASLLFMVVLVLALQGRDAQASTAAMVQMHRDIVAGKVDTLKVASIDDANRAIAAFAVGFPTLAEPPQTHTMECCLRNVGNKKVACVLLDAQGTPVTLSIAKTDAVSTAGTTMVSRHGVNYHVQTLNDLTMVMLDRDGHHVCVIGALPTDKLIALVEGVRF